jgi:hypothetical protein
VAVESSTSQHLITPTVGEQPYTKCHESTHAKRKGDADLEDGVLVVADDVVLVAIVGVEQPEA